MGGVLILAGIGLTIFGVRFLRKGLDRLFAGNLMAWLSGTISNRFRAFFGGIGLGMLTPSSSGIALLITQVASNSQIPSRNILASLLGANIGLTIAVQLIAFRLQDYAGIFIIVGVLAFQFLKREVFRGIGQCILALGFVFLSIKLIGDGAQSAAASSELQEALVLLARHPMLVLIAVGVVTVFLQSSTATIGLGLGLSASGLLVPEIMVPWVLGTTLGLAITLLIAGWNTLAGRRLGIANLMTKAIVILPLVFFPQLALALFEWFPGSLNRQTAMFYTELSVLIGVLSLPFLGLLERVSLFMIPEPESPYFKEQESFLDDQVLEIPALALARATRETLRMSDKVQLMLETFWTVFMRGSPEIARRIQQEDDTVDRINLQLNNYLSRISEGKSEADTHWQFLLLGFANDLESAGDIIDKHLCDLVIKQGVEGIVLEPEDREVLVEAYHRLHQRFETAAGLLTSRDTEEARVFLCGKETFNEWSRKVQREHYERFHSSSWSKINSSAFFLDFLNAFRRINSHISSIGYALSRREAQEK